MTTVPISGEAAPELTTIPPYLRMRHITKRFPGVIALEDV
jgi:hypothetical protein